MPLLWGPFVTADCSHTCRGCGLRPRPGTRIVRMPPPELFVRFSLASRFYCLVCPRASVVCEHTQGIVCTHLHISSNEPVLDVHFFLLGTHVGTRAVHSTAPEVSELSLCGGVRVEVRRPLGQSCPRCAFVIRVLPAAAVRTSMLRWKCRIRVCIEHVGGWDALLELWMRVRVGGQVG